MPNTRRQLRGFGRRKPPPGAQVDPSHPLARGLIGAWLLNEGGGSNAFDSAGLVGNGVITTPAWAPGPHSGPATLVNGATGYTTIPPGKLPLGAARRTIAFGFQSSGATSGSFLFTYGAQSAGQFVSIYVKSSGILEFSGFGTPATFDGTTNLQDGKYHQLVYTYDGGTAHSIYLDGKPEAAGAFTANTSNAGGAQLTLGTPNNGPGAAGFTLIGGLDYFYVWDVFFHLPQQMQLLNKEPFGFFRQPAPKRAIGSHTVVVAGVTAKPTYFIQAEAQRPEEGQALHQRGFAVAAAPVVATYPFPKANIVQREEMRPDLMAGRSLVLPATLAEFGGTIPGPVGISIHHTLTMTAAGSPPPRIAQTVTLHSQFGNNLPAAATLTSLTIGGRFNVVNGDMASGRFRR